MHYSLIAILYQMASNLSICLIRMYTHIHRYFNQTILKQFHYEFVFDVPIIQ